MDTLTISRKATQCEAFLKRCMLQGFIFMAVQHFGNHSLKTAVLDKGTLMHEMSGKIVGHSGGTSEIHLPILEFHL